MLEASGFPLVQQESRNGTDAVPGQCSCWAGLQMSKFRFLHKCAGSCCSCAG